MESYKRVASSRTAAPASLKENEIRITAQGLSGSYVSYAMSLFQDSNATEVVLTAMGRVISKAVLVAEIIKKKIRGLHQDISLASSDVKDVWEPLEEGLNTLEMVRHVSMISITLSTKQLDVASCGYQPPNTKQVHPLSDLNHEEGGRRGGARTYVRGNMRPGIAHYDAENWNPGRSDYGVRGRSYGGGRGYSKDVGQGDMRSVNRGFAMQGNMRGYNKGDESQADAKGYRYTNLQVSNRGQNSYYPPDGNRRYNGGNMQSNMRGYNQQAPARGYNQQAPARDYNVQRGGARQYNDVTRDNYMAFNGQGGGGGRGRGRGRFGR